MNFKSIGKGEILALLGGVLLAIGLFMTWFMPNPRNKNAIVMTGGKEVRLPVSGWEVYPILRWLLLAAAIAPFILLYIALRNNSLSWPRGEATAVIAIFSFGLVAFNGLIQNPGQPPSETSLQIGYFVALLGTALMVVGAAARSSMGRKPQPPGV